MRIPIRVKIQDWFADHFGTQYAVPRAKPKGEPSRYVWFALEFAKVAMKASAYIPAFAFVMLLALKPKRGEQPVALLFLAALLCWLAGSVFSFLI